MGSDPLPSSRPIVIDTSGLPAAIASAQQQHAAARDVLRDAGVPLVLSPFVLAELDYLLQTRIGSQAQLAFFHEVERGAYRLEPFSASDFTEAIKIMERYADLEVGLADASIVVLCNRHDTSAILTLDERHFRAVLSLDDRPLNVLPADCRQRG